MSSYPIRHFVYICCPMMIVKHHHGEHHRRGHHEHNAVEICTYQRKLHMLKTPNYRVELKVLKYMYNLYPPVVTKLNLNIYSFIYRAREVSE